MSRIDRVHFRAPSNIIYIKNLDLPEEDGHCPVLFQAVSSNEKPPPTRWRLHPSLFMSRRGRKELSSALQEVVPDDFPNVLEYLQEVKAVTKRVQKKLSDGQRKWINRLKHVLQHIPRNSEARKRHNGELRTIGRLNKDKKAMLAGKYRVLNNECPDAMLTRILKTQRAKSSVSKIRHPVSGHVETDSGGVLDAFHCFYSELYGSLPSDRTLFRQFLDAWKPNAPRNHINNLAKPFESDELEVALKQMKDLKAPGSNGMPTLPFKLLPEKGMESMLKLFNTILSTGKVPNEWKQGEIITLFKKGDPLDIGNRRPITLLQTEYKILSKMVTNRLNGIIGKIIHPDQVGFMPRRIIHDNVLVAHEILQFSDKFAINVDFKKAYDSVDHNAIFDTLDHLRMPRGFIALIKDMITGSKARVWNGHQSSEWFNIERGVKQGDPLSPLLFALVIEPLANYIRVKTKGVKLGNLTQQILLYADDIFLFAQDYVNQQIQLNILDDFRLATGLAMNKTKSFHISSHQQHLCIPAMPDGGFKYLGFWFDANGLVDRTDILLDKIRDAVSRWRFFSWNTRTKATVLKCYILSKIWYYTFLTDISGNSEDLEELCRDFMWTNRWDSRITRRVKMRKDRARVDAGDGGLGLFDIAARLKAQKVWVANTCWTRQTKIGPIWQELYSFSPDGIGALSGHPNKLVQGVWDAYQGIPTHHRFEYEPAADDPEPSDHVPLSGLKEWTQCFAPPNGPIRTKRQERLLADKSVDLIQVFRNSKRYLRDIKLRDFVWNLCNGTLLYDRKKKCPCGEKRDIEHILFKCVRIKACHAWYANHPSIALLVSPDDWTEKLVFQYMERSRSRVHLAIYSSLLRSLWICKDAPLPSQNWFLSSLRSAMISDWYFAMNHPDHRNIPGDQIGKFVNTWGSLVIQNGEDLPTLRRLDLADQEVDQADQ